MPLHIRNAPTRLMKELGYGRNYKYARDYADAFDPQQYLPETLQGTSFFEPRDRGCEKLIKQRLDHWRRQMAKNMSSRKG